MQTSQENDMYEQVIEFLENSIQSSTQFVYLQYVILQYKNKLYNTYIVKCVFL